MARIALLPLLVPALLSLVGCLEVAGVEPIDVIGRPGLKPWYAKQDEAKPLPPAVAPPPQPPPPAPLPFPPARVAGTEAERLLEGDPIALRFLILREAAEDGQVPAADALARIAANKGALLPLSQAQPPASGLDQPVPPAAGILARLRALNAGQARGDADSRARERAFLLDSLLPAQPAARELLTPPDAVAARQLLNRLIRLEAAGLIDADEHARERQAIEALLASGRLPETLASTLPPPPPPPPKPRKTAPKRGPFAGIIPTPAKAELPRLTPEYKGPAGIHLLSMAAPGNADKAWAALQKEFPELGPLSFKVAKADLGDLGVTYRLIAGPLDAPAAEQMCGALRAKGQGCTPTPMPP